MKNRAYTDDDLESLLDLWYRASLIAHSFLPDAFFATERDLIASQWVPIAETTICEVEGAVVGFLSLIGNEVGAIFVDPAHHGEGVGRKLMDAALDSRPFLELSVFEANSIGRAFYDRYGFVVVGRQLNEATGHPELRMRLDPPRSARG